MADRAREPQRGVGRLIMFDLDEQLRRWRLETEATLAFEPDEIDELEDHLKFAVEQAVADGASPEHAWQTAITRVGASPSLALEFAKSKLLPALFHLVTSWWKPVVLLLMFILLECTTHGMNSSAPGSKVTLPDATFWILTWSCFVTLFVLLPGRVLKIAYLLGIGNAFCLIPLLHVTFYNSLAEQIIGRGWSRMASSFGVIPVGLGFVGLFVINHWGWLRGRTNRSALPAIWALSAAIILLLALSPFVSALIGNLSIRDVFSMPTAPDITLTGSAKTNFMTWKFDDVLMDCVLTITTWLPFVLLAVVCAGTLGLQQIARALRFESPELETTFPARRDLPWIMALAGNGGCWFLACFVEPAFCQEIGNAEAGGLHPTGIHFGVAAMTVAPALCFLICGYELTKRLHRAPGLRYFYATMLVAGEAAVLVGVTLLPALLLPRPLAGYVYPSSEPEWLSAVLSLTAAWLASRQVLLIGTKVRGSLTTTSIWKFDCDDLVRFGSSLGLIIACSGLILTMVALVVAFESTSMISAMVAWGNSIKDPATNHFAPENYSCAGAMVSPLRAYPTPQLVFWIYSGINYVSICLAIGMAVAIVLSGLEFIRFNTFRLYRARKAARMLPDTLAINE